jgi:hypothetical protein
MMMDTHDRTLKRIVALIQQKGVANTGETARCKPLDRDRRPLHFSKGEAPDRPAREAK